MGILIATDGGCKWQGTPNCLAAGVAVSRIDNFWSSKLRAETQESSSQRGELMGFLCALDVILENREEALTGVTIVTDSEYILKSITLEWLWRWEAQGWLSATGEPVKNKDYWELILKCFKEFPELKELLNMQYIKGHIVKYNQTMFNNAMKDGLQSVVDNLQSLITRPVSKQQTIDMVTKEITSRGYALFKDPDHIIDIVLANTLADTVVTNVVALLVANVDKTPSGF